MGIYNYCYSRFWIAGWHVAEKLSIPAVAAYLWPATPSRYMPGATGQIPPPWIPFTGLFNYLSTKLSNQLFFRMMLPTINACRTEVLGLRPLPWKLYSTLDIDPEPIVYGYSRHVVPVPPEHWLLVSDTGPFRATLAAATAAAGAVLVSGNATRATAENVSVGPVLLAAGASFDGGDLKGRFVYDGTPPARKPVVITADKEFCGKQNILEENLVVEVISTMSAAEAATRPGQALRKPLFAFRLIFPSPGGRLQYCIPTVR